MRRDEPIVGETIAVDHVQETECERGVGAGMGLYVDVCELRGGVANGIDRDHGGPRLAQPVGMRVWGRCRWVGPPDDDAPTVRERLRVETLVRGSDHVSQRHVSGVVADRVGVDLGGAQPVEEAHGELAREQRAGPRVVGVQDRLRPVTFDDVAQARRDFAQRVVPGAALESGARLRAAAAQRVL